MLPDVTSPSGSATTTRVLSQEQKQCVLTPAADASFGLVLSGTSPQQVCPPQGGRGHTSKSPGAASVA